MQSIVSYPDRGVGLRQDFSDKPYIAYEQCYDKQRFHQKRD